MQISKFETLEQFDELQAEWEQVYIADASAHVFVSWTWLRGWFEITPYAWFVLAFRPDTESACAAFLPLIVRGPRLFKFQPIRVLNMGGQPLAAYTGFVCLPEYQEQALAAFAAYLQHRLDWDRFQIEEFLDPRLDSFLKYFSQEEEFNIQQSYGMPSLYIPLPGQWNDYLQEQLGSKTRRNLRHSLKKLENFESFRLSSTQGNRLEKDLEILFTLWQGKWGPKPWAQLHRKILRYYCVNNSLELTILWYGEMPLSALASIIDPLKKTVYAYIVGRSDQLAKLSPGRAIFGYDIRSAIERGFLAYDFLVGGDDYKFSFGAQQADTKNVIIKRKKLKGITTNILIDLINHIGRSLKTVLGKLKRVKIFKQIWFGLTAIIRRYKPR